MRNATTSMYQSESVTVNKKYLCCSEIRKQRRVLMIDGNNDACAIVTLLKMRAQIVLALVVGADVAAEHGAFTAMVNH